MIVRARVTSCIEVPLDQNVHKVVHAFFRTSEWGEWQADDEKQSDEFVLNYRRGVWKRPLLGSGLKPHTQSMRLRITLRPSPQNVKIAVEHTFFFDNITLSPRDGWAYLYQNAKPEMNNLGGSARPPSTPS